MAHWCRICDQHKPNEKFSGKGHRDHICKLCSRRPTAERDAIDQEREIHGYFEQRNISRKNLKRLTSLTKSTNPRISELAETVLSVGKAKPHKRKRLAFLARHYPEVMEKLGAVGLIIPREEYRAMWHNPDHCEIEIMLLQRDMDQLHFPDDNLIDPGEIGRLLLEYFELMNSEAKHQHSPAIDRCNALFR